MMGPKSLKAVSNVKTLITSFPDHGVIDVFKLYPIRDVLSSILILAKLQWIVKHHEDQDAAKQQAEQKSLGGESHIEEHPSPELLQKLAHYSAYANAAYGWRFDLALKGRVQKNDLATLLKSTGIAEEDVIKAEWKSDAMRPAYLVCADRNMETIVVCIRGTLSPQDVLTDLCAAAKEYGADGRAHQGMLEGAQCVNIEAKPIVIQALQDNPGYSLVIVGHSLGSGVASILGTLWEEEFQDVQVYGFGSPCVGPPDVKPTRSTNMISVVNEGDPFSCLSLGHVADISHAIAELCKDKELRLEAKKKTKVAAHKMQLSDLEWCRETIKALADKSDAEKFLPPGKILYLRQVRQDNGKMGPRLLTVPQSQFTDLRLHSRMLDVTRHIPSLYESKLHELSARFNTATTHPSQGVKAKGITPLPRQQQHGGVKKPFAEIELSNTMENTIEMRLIPVY